MIKLSEFGKKYVFTTRIDIDADGYVVLREPNQQEVINLSDDPKKQVEAFSKIFPACVVESSFIHDDGSQASGKEIAEALSQSGTLYTDILTTWLTSLPFRSRLMKKEK